MNISIIQMAFLEVILVAAAAAAATSTATNIAMIVE